ncbi:hypothetical protein ZIOFF_070829 [Zingiber officinale]|uniref:Pectinesterase n=1 Tax=Zingiber officinale TaxID=94328 RepID=A0A8J5CUC8_ZINOF|nr:hypothetical protein ZIOFF_070829 [Zingiber officinale]
MDAKLLATFLIAALLLTIPTADSARRRRRRLDPGLVLAERNRRVITVSKDGRGNFRTVIDALRSIPRGNTRRVIVKIGPGVYTEKLLLHASKPYVTFYGHPRAMPTISYGATAYSKNGTWRSATVAVESDYFVAANIIFENTAPRPGVGMENAQAVAMRISGDKAAFFNCKFYGFQDTLCDDRGRHFFKDCFIRGTVDFIFGYGRSLYKNCEIQSVADGVTYITAQGRSRSRSDDHGGFSFVDCRITGTGSAYLGRAWRNMSRVVFARTYMGKNVDPRGWDDKGNPADGVFCGVRVHGARGGEESAGELRERAERRAGEAFLDDEVRSRADMASSSAETDHVAS